VVASSTRRSFVMMMWIPEGRKVLEAADQRTGIRPDCGSVQTLIRIYFVRHKDRKRHCSLRIHAMAQVGMFVRPRKLGRVFRSAHNDPGGPLFPEEPAHSGV